MSDIIAFKNGWVLSSLVKTPTGYYATIEKEIDTTFHPHTVTKFKAGTGITQKEALVSAMNAKGYAQEALLHGTKRA